MEYWFQCVINCAIFAHAIYVIFGMFGRRSGTVDLIVKRPMDLFTLALQLKGGIINVMIILRCPIISDVIKLF